MHIVPPVADELLFGLGIGAGLLLAPEPRILGFVAVGFTAAVFVPFDFHPLAQDVGGRERADVHAHAVVQVGLPAFRLFRERLPADEEVVGGLAIKDGLELVLQGLGGTQAGVGAGLLGFRFGGLVRDPRAEVEPLSRVILRVSGL